MRFLFSRKTAALILILSVVVAAGFFASARYIMRPRVEPGVKFCDSELDDYTLEEVEELVAAKIGEWQIEPVDAVYYPEQDMVIPELWGYNADVRETISKIKSAAPGENVYPAFRPIFPEVTVEDYPWAVIRQGNPQKRQVSFMINVAWGEEYIPSMLRLFADRKIGATFFVVGSWAEKNEHLLRKMVEKGHCIGNHGHTDAVTYPELPPHEVSEGLSRVNDFVQRAAGQEVRYFTPHKGEYNHAVLEVVSRKGMRTVLWSIDTVDWMEPGVEEMKNKVLEKLHPGAIILMHPMEDTVQFLKETIPYIQDEDYEIVTVEELLNPDYPPLDYFN